MTKHDKCFFIISTKIFIVNIILSHHFILIHLPWWSDILLYEISYLLKILSSSGLLSYSTYTNGQNHNFHQISFSYFLKYLLFDLIKSHLTLHLLRRKIFYWKYFYFTMFDCILENTKNHFQVFRFITNWKNFTISWPIISKQPSPVPAKTNPLPLHQPPKPPLDPHKPTTTLTLHWPLISTNWRRRKKRKKETKVGQPPTIT